MAAAIAAITSVRSPNEPKSIRKNCASWDRRRAPTHAYVYLGADNVFDVYRNGRRDLLILSRRRIAKVSDEIKSAVQTQGYHIRSLRATQKRKIDVK
ncbi:hypothetical protein QA641_06825 [Bradyrhizobium sp. CB1650]|uniref:hypothetical protein n=1 Tax=Bradyrhizobium sp. CB1650 TaxID=3039153 RepID=UPI00243592DA|nr:hypothetical protein [Bradyrhizobium sp. CB1650]WGD56914.1 hypothetical protein QA641_06825 [Bradyrhizobium sp. CB1650]